MNETKRFTNNNYTGILTLTKKLTREVSMNRKLYREVLLFNPQNLHVERNFDFLAIKAGKSSILNGP